MTEERVPYIRRDDHRSVTLDGQLVDENGRPVPNTSGWRQHPQQLRRLHPYGRPDQIDALADQDAAYGYGHPAQPAINVSVNNGGQYYRPWKDELKIKGGSMLIDFFAWPFRLVASFFESLVSMAGRALWMIFMIIVLPTLLFSGMAFYQSHKDRPAAETAHEVGKAGVGLVGSVLSGIWDGIFGGDEKPAPTKREADKPDINDDASSSGEGHSAAHRRTRHAEG